MSAKHWMLSVFVVWHLTATTLGSLASPGAVRPVDPPRHPDHDVVAGTLTPALDSIAAAAAPMPDAVLRGAGPLRRLADLYLQTIGVSQSWKMFSNPPEVDWYLRARYFVGRSPDEGGPGEPLWTATELILPAHREDRMRLVTSYWDSFRDKAVTSALQRFHSKRHDGLLKPDTKSSELPDDLAPIGRYFARRFQREALKADERILRTEIWYGVAPMPPPGGTLDRSETEARARVLWNYYEGPVERRFGRPVYPLYHILQWEADIRWYLEYFEP
jgi:hypothetical protein